VNTLTSSESNAIVSAGKGRSLYVVLKVTERCNLACPYCYFFFAGDDSFKIHPPSILGQTVDGLIAFLQDAVARTGVTVINIGLHGGEPLLLKKETFRRMCTRLQQGLAGRCKLGFSIQTNGVLIDPDWVSLFAEFNIHAGISFDGPEAVHNLTRITKKGVGTYAESRRGWELLMEAAQAGRIAKPGILCVVAPEQSARDTYTHFVDALKADQINFLWPDVNHDSPEATSAFIDGCGDYMIEVCRTWFAAGRSDVRVRFIREVLGPLLDEQVCRDIAGMKNDPFGLITVSSNGDIAADDIVRTLAPRFRETGLRVGANSLSELATTPAWIELGRAQKQLPESCRGCTWKNVCRGGSFQNRYSEARGFDNPSVYCPSLKRVYGYIASNVIGGGHPVARMEQILEARMD
jgi:uncharacterized protein